MDLALLAWTVLTFGVSMQMWSELRRLVSVKRVEKTVRWAESTFPSVLVGAGTAGSVLALQSRDGRSPVEALVLMVVTIALGLVMSEVFRRDADKDVAKLRAKSPSVVEDDLLEEPVIQVSGRPSKSRVPLILGAIAIAAVVASRRSRAR